LAANAVVVGQKAAIILPNQATWLNQAPQMSFPTGNIPGFTVNELVENAKTYLKTNINDLKNENTGLVLTQNITSPFARYITFQETYLGNEIYGTSIKIGIDKENKIISVISKTGAVDNWTSNTTIPIPDTSQIKSAIGDCDRFNIQEVWFYTAEEGIPAFQVNCSKSDGTRDDELILDENYNIIYRNSLIKNYKYPDSLATMFVFYPDPLTSAHHSYSEPYINHNDSDVLALDSQMQPKQIRVSVLKGDSFFLENQFVIEKDLAAPRYSESTYSKTPFFFFRRDSSAFRDLMIYYHLNNYRNHMKDLGYDSLGYTQVVVDPSGETGDNSTFYPPNGSGLGTIYFGVGGIPDAEDADVPTHEYSHFISYSACHNCSSSGIERLALDEATGDYFAASNSKAIDTFGWRKIFNWDGNNPSQSWYGRSCAINDIYPDALVTFQGDKYRIGQLWSSALIQIWDSIGRTKTDRIMFETLYSMASGLTMPQAAKLYLKNDSLIYNNADRNTITYYFVKRGFLPGSGLVTTPRNPQIWYKITTSYFPTANEVFFDFGLPQTGTLSLYDMTGKLIAAQAVSNSEHVQFTAPPIADGIYILGVNTGGLQKSFKLLK